MAALLFTLLAFFTHVEDQPGPYKHCMYDLSGSVYILTLRDHQVCPVSVEVDI